MLKILVIGHLGKDAEVRNANGKNVINFSVAHSEKFKDAQGVQQDKSVWVECAYWTEKTAIAPYLKKGTQVYVEGQPEVEQYTTNDGRTGVKLKCRVASIQLLGSKEGGGASNVPNPTSANYQEPASQSAAPAVNNSVDDDLPF